MTSLAIAAALWSDVTCHPRRAWLISRPVQSKMASKEAAASALKVVVFLGTVRENNMGTRAARFVLKRLQERGFAATLLGG